MNFNLCFIVCIKSDYNFGEGGADPVMSHSC
jgi:hypothetical protein